jgi:LysR family glycine cleavage system transcriptional activator
MFLNSSILGSIRFFATAARTLSFKRAALALHVTQGAVSQHIRRLENALGCKLFVRLPREVALTSEGKLFASVVLRALDDIERSAQEITLVRASTPELRLRAGPSFALRWLVPRLGDFHARHKRIRLFVEATFGPFDPTRREFDLAIELVKGKIPGMRCEPLMPEYLVPVCTPTYLKAHADLKDPKDFDRCTLLHDSHPWLGATEDAEWRYWLRKVGASTVDSTRGRFFSLANMAIEAALTDQGVAMGRIALVRELVESGRLVMPVKKRIRSPTQYCLVYHSELAARPELGAVTQWLREQVSGTNA